MLQDGKLDFDEFYLQIEQTYFDVNMQFGNDQNDYISKSILRDTSKILICQKEYSPKSDTF